MNIVVLEGNLTRDVEYTTVGSNNIPCARFGIAVNTKKGDREEVFFGDVVVFGKQAETARDTLHKGSRCVVQGRMKTDQWEGQGGAKKTATRVVCERLIPVGAKLQSSGGAYTDTVPPDETDLEPF